MPRYLPVRSPFYAQFERWPYTRGPNYTRAMFREQGSGGHFTAQPMNRMPPLMGIGYVGLSEPIGIDKAKECDTKCTGLCPNLGTCYSDCIKSCTYQGDGTTPTPPDETKVDFPKGPGYAKASFFSDFFTNPTKMIGALAVAGVALWWVTSRRPSYARKNNSTLEGYRRRLAELYAEKRQLAMWSFDSPTYSTGLSSTVGSIDREIAQLVRKIDEIERGRR